MAATVAVLFLRFLLFFLLILRFHIAPLPSSGIRRIEVKRLIAVLVKLVSPHNLYAVSVVVRS